MTTASCAPRNGFWTRPNVLRACPNVARVFRPEGFSRFELMHPNVHANVARVFRPEGFSRFELMHPNARANVARVFRPEGFSRFELMHPNVRANVARVFRPEGFSRFELMHPNAPANVARVFRPEAFPHERPYARLVRPERFRGRSALSWPSFEISNLKSEILRSSSPNH